ncbi:MAG TPA: LuxR family transcriptional regulator [Acidimicrobiales bacterium]|nr:LuxR family transcriptional regulator [Acidimicrobiales bacterium]
MSEGDVLDEGRGAYGRRAWAEAYDRLSAADRRVALGADDLERLATAAYLTGHDATSSDAWTRAHQARLDAGDPEGAVRCAFWLGFGFVQRGEVAQGGGWLARARSLVDEHRLDCVESAYLLLPAALMALDRGDHDTAGRLCDEAGAAARRFGDADLAALGRIGRGQSLLGTGRVAEAGDLFDEAMVAVTAGELSAVVAGIVYCAVIDACHEAFDVRRAREWTYGLSRWCEAQPGLVAYRGQCLVHRSQVMQLNGAWAEALDEAHRARQRLAEPPHPAIGMAHYQLGELLRLRGELDEAEQAYRRANDCGRSPQPGLSLVRLGQGRVDAAVAAIERAVDDAADNVSRARVLPAYVEIMLAAERVPEARAAADELALLADGAGAPYLHAAAAQARGAVSLAGGEPKAALEPLRAAWRAWRELDAPYEAAQARLLVAAACRAVGDHDGADLECDAARRAFEELGAAPALARLDALVAAGDDDAAHDVTKREREVLRLVAGGRTNRQIATELGISAKTVERHLSNIFIKLGVANRAAATAYAYDHDLV